MRVVARPAFTNRSANPYTSLLYESIRPLVDEIVEYRTLQFQCSRVDIVHVHWPDRVMENPSPIRATMSSAAFLSRILEYKLRGAKVIWTVHNVVPHDLHHPLLMASFWPIFLRLADGAVFMSSLSRSETYAVHPRTRYLPYAIIPHGHYKPVITSVKDKPRAREDLGLPADRFIFLYFGLVREYKNVPLLVREFIDLNRSNTYLVVAGRTAGPDREQLQASLERLASGRSNIRLDLKFIPDQTLHTYLAACDVVVLPYKRMLNSGSVLLALSAGRPVIGPKTGSIPELEEQVGSAWMRSYSGDFDKCYLLEAMKHPMPSQYSPDLSYYDWDAIASQTVEFYRRIGSRQAQ